MNYIRRYPSRHTIRSIVLVGKETKEEKNARKIFVTGDKIEGLIRCLSGQISFKSNVVFVILSLLYRIKIISFCNKVVEKSPATFILSGVSFSICTYIVLFILVRMREKKELSEYIAKKICNLRQHFITREARTLEFSRYVHLVC